MEPKDLLRVGQVNTIHLTTGEVFDVLVDTVYDGRVSGHINSGPWEGRWECSLHWIEEVRT